MISEYDCLVVPVMTEKSMNAVTGTHVFKVNPKATKFDVRRAVEKVFNVKVASVNVLNRSGKKKTFRGKYGETKSTRFAIVRLAEGTINYEGGI